MPRVLLRIVFVCCLAAAAAVTAVITSDVVSRDLSAKPVAASAAPTARGALAAPEESPGPAPVEALPPSSGPAEAASDQPVAEDAALASAKLATADPKAFVNGLSPEQQEKLAKALLERRLVDIRKQNSYTLPTDYRLMELERVQGGRLALNDVQKLQLADIRQMFKGRIEAATGDLYSRDEDVRRRLRQKAEALGPAGQAEHADELKELQQEWSGIREEMRQAKAEVDTEYAAAVEGMLNDEQKQALADVPMPTWLLKVSDRP